MTTLKCTYNACDVEAACLMAKPMLRGTCVFVAPYCAKHADELREFGAVPAGGPACSVEARKIEGLR